MDRFSKWIQSEGVLDTVSSWGDKIKGYFSKMPQEQPTITPEPKRVTFGKSNLNDITSATKDYLGLVKRFFLHVQNELQKSGSQDGAKFAKNSFNHVVLPHYQKMNSWITWANDMIAQLPQKNEAVKVNYRNFEHMAGSMQDLTTAMHKWMNQLSQNMGPHFMKSIKNVYDNNLVTKSAQLAKQFMWLNNKIKELMTARGRDYQGLENRNKNARQANTAPHVAKNPQTIPTRDDPHQGLGVSMLSKGLRPEDQPMVPVRSRRY